MPTDHRAALAKIKRFDQLVAYLRDEMGWPIARDSFEDVNDLFYDFTAEELGIDPKTAAKIESIKRLRPLSPKQPWGIFFVKFEPKNLPVVALRRILGQVALKKRPSANSAERAAWAADDLLFISNYGEGDKRQITFAHFSKAVDGHDLPTLKVLGWDNLDTALHLDSVAKELTQHLSWPEDDTDAQAWRQSWRAAFNLRHQEVVTTSRDLSVRLAELARAIRDRIRSALTIENEAGPLTKLMKAFQEALVHDLDADGFADMYAQTIAYGLLSARIADPEKKTADDFAAHMRTNPFLRELMETFLKVGGRRGQAGGPGIDFDELGVSEVVELLDNANMEAVVRDFGDRNPQEDPVIHFYELFLKEYDAKKRMKSGVFYTPRPVVSYIVKSVDMLLRTEFGLEDGLADTTSWAEMVERQSGLTIPEGVSANQDFVRILDPATGTGTFLVEVIEVIYKTLVAKWAQQGHGEKKINALWNEYVPRHLLPRLHGYELLMAPYAIAHLKIGLKLYETGYRFASDERARIYLTNALEPAQDFSAKFEFAAPALAHEAKAVNEVKRHKSFTVVIGNPPYSSSITEPAWLMRLLESWKLGLKEAKSDLNREEWKFLRFSQYLCESTHCGILGFIINRDFLDGITKRVMREQLNQTFPLGIIVDLNGDVKGNISDENVFEIEQGVAIAILCTHHDHQEIRFSSRVGSRSSKYSDLLVKDTIDRDLSALEIAAPYFRWVPFVGGGQATNVATEYSSWFSLGEMFGVYSSGIQTKNDAVCIAWTENEIWDRVNFLQDAPIAQVRRDLQLHGDGAWSITKAREDLRTIGISKTRVRKILYRPFDWRFTYFTEKSGGFLGRPRFEVMKHMTKGSNLGLIFNRQIVGKTVSQFGVSRDLISHGTFYLGNKGQDYLAPLYLNNDDSLRFGESDRRSNFSPAFLSALRRSRGVDESYLGPEEVLQYVFAVVHSPTYRSRYGEHLKLDFSRVPITSKRALFDGLSRLGAELIALQLMESSKLDQAITTYSGPNSPTIARVGWSDDTVWLDEAAAKKKAVIAAETAGFRGVPQSVWEFEVGGYQVCEKWLKDRKGRTLSKADIAHYQKIVTAVSVTIAVMREVDALIEEHGGWPGAFAQSDGTANGAAKQIEDAGNLVPLVHPKFTAAVYQADPSQMLKAAETEAPPYETVESSELDGARSNRDELDREDLICRIRQLFGDGQERERETAIDALARELGYQRTGKRIHDELDNALRTAVRRGILTSEPGTVRLFARTIEQYDRDFLKEQFLASLLGPQWIEREDAAPAFARWMGFRRTGPAIQDTARSLINGLLREGRLESGGSQIRRSG